MKTELKYWCFALVTALVLSGISLLFGGCATTGTIAPALIEQSADVDTSISHLQTAQTDTAATVEQIDATQQDIAAATKDSAPAVVTLVTQQSEQIKKLKEQRTVEQKATTAVQSVWSTFKISSGTEMVNQSARVNKLTAQLKLAHKWTWILGSIDGFLILGLAVYILLKIYKRL
jgi:hypothetical protein